MSASVKYECEICDERGFETRKEWLLHLVVNRHSLKAREKIQQVYLESNGGFFIITGIENLDRCILVHYLANRLTSFANFICFKPEANVSLIVCDESEFADFLKTPHVIGGSSLTFRNYNEVTQSEWKSYFAQKNPKHNTTNVRQDQCPGSNPSTVSSNNANQTAVSSNGAASSSSAGQNVDTDSFNKKETNGTQDNVGIKLEKQEIKVEKLEAMEEKNDDEKKGPGHSDGKGKDQPLDAETIFQKHKVPMESLTIPESKLLPAESSVWSACGNEVEEIRKSIIMSDVQRTVRETFLKQLKATVLPRFSNCQLIPVGLDFLGFKLADDDIFTVYFDNHGYQYRGPSGSTGSISINESEGAVEKTRTVLVELLSGDAQNRFRDIRFEGPNSILCVSHVFDVVPLKCRIIMKSFKLLQTALLCKNLFFKNQECMSLMTFITYWTKAHNYVDIGLLTPYNIYWLGYIFLMMRKMLPSVSELQNACNYQLMHSGYNVAFSVDTNVLHSFVKLSDMNKIEPRSQLILLAEWFKFMDGILNRCAKTPGPNRCHSVVCPRFGDLIDKRPFGVVRETHAPIYKKKNLKGKQKHGREVWTELMRKAGFPECTWVKLQSIKLPDTLCIQHPLYYAENISLNFNGPVCKQFFRQVAYTRKKLEGLLLVSKKKYNNGVTESSLIQALTSTP